MCTGRRMNLSANASPDQTACLRQLTPTGKAGHYRTFIRANGDVDANLVDMKMDQPDLIFPAPDSDLGPGELAIAEEAVFVLLIIAHWTLAQGLLVSKPDQPTKRALCGRRFKRCKCWLMRPCCLSRHR